MGTALAGLAASSAAGQETPPLRSSLGILLYSYGLRARAEKGFAEPKGFLRFCHERGAAGVQLPIGARQAGSAAEVRRTCDDLRMYLEGIVRCPADENDAERFENEIVSAKACGATVLRTVMLGGRRYEEFATADDYPRFAQRAFQALRRAEPIARKHGVKLAVENHKDYRTDELLDLLRKLSSEHVGVCLDTGNNIALLEEPHEVVRALAPFALTVHFKDMALEESADGFRLAEVPLGQGFLDLKSIVVELHKANPKIHFNLEMITRDPLSIPCLTDKYWATLGKVPGRDLARTLALVRRTVRPQPLPRISQLKPDEQLAIEERHVRESLAFAAREKLIRVA
jgi:sugar phosphate isomerase/epimerase